MAQNKLPSDFKLRIAGDGPLRTELEEQARGLPIEFLGNQPQSEISRLLASSEIFVLPSRVAKSGDREGLPVTLMEAAASSSFVVASKLAGIDELVVDGESGLLVQPDDPAQLIEALAAGLADPNLRRRLARELSLSAQRFDIKVIGDQYNALLRSLK
jgi:glycosyltransferase involved in cell wall biosynthesis